MVAGMTMTVDVAMRDRAVEVLCDSSLEHIVDLVAWPDGDAVYVANSAGAARLTSAGAELLQGRNPVGLQDPLAFTPLTAELADRSPANATNSYPYAHARLAGLLAADAAPDIAVVHTGRHHWPDKGGHPGEHGSLGVVQSRAPLVLSGAGVTARGLLPLSARVVDIAPTLAWLAGVPLAALSDMDGAALVDVLAPGETQHVVGLLWDGCNSNSLYALARSGDLPNVARLLHHGCAFTGGSIAEFPSVTLVNHTSALTGVGPGTHGIVNNAFYDRVLGQQVVANSSATWHGAMQWLRPGVTTVFERLPPGVRSACVNEPVDVGATYSTFALIREGGLAGNLSSHLPATDDDPHATQVHVAADKDYAWSTQVDRAGLDQALSLWREDVPPRLMWWNTTLTDSGHHAGGPGSDIARASMRDADRRLGVWLDLVEARGLLDDTVVILTADHGSEAADPSCTGDWGDALRQARVPFRDEAYGFLYLGHDVGGL